MRVLMIEDNKDASAAISAALPEYEVVTVRTAIEAVSALVSLGPFDAILLDENLPNFTENHGPTGPRRARDGAILFEGSHLLPLIKKLTDCPKVIVAISAVSRANRRLRRLGATHRVDGKDPVSVRHILTESL